MVWNLDKSRPICPQLCEQLCAQIAVGDLIPGQKLMSVREMAVNAGVNPNTVQRAFEQLEQQGVLYSVRGAGWYVAEDPHAARDMQSALANAAVKEFLDKMAALGYAPEEAKTMVKEWNGNG